PEHDAGDGRNHTPRGPPPAHACSIGMSLTQLNPRSSRLMGSTVIVDAENVRRSLWPNLSREELVERARAWAAREGHDLRIVFDSTPPENGDRLASELEGPVWVVASDRELRERLSGHVDRVIGGGRSPGACSRS